MRFLTFSFLLVFMFVPNAIALPVIIDFDYSNSSAPDFFIVDDIYRGVPVADYDEGPPNIPAFFDSGVTFVNVEFASSPLATDGYAITDAGYGQYGSFSLFWDEPIQSATLNFVNADIGGPLFLDVDAGDYEFSTISNLLWADTLTLLVNSSEPFMHLEILGHGSTYLDSVEFNSAPVPEPATFLLLCVGCGAIIKKRSKISRHK